MGIEKKKRIALSIQTEFGKRRLKWFLCFGALLSVVRDKELDISQDIDIGVIGSINELYHAKKEESKIHNYIKSNQTGNILNFSYRHSDGVCIDVFRWVKFKGMYWHTYDYKMEYPKNGVPTSYHFKSMPTEIFDLDENSIFNKIRDTKYNNHGKASMSSKGTWTKSLPEAPTEGIDLQIPYMYGYFLDIAYPDWSTERKQFGQSKGYTEIDINSCKGYC